VAIAAGLVERGHEVRLCLPTTFVALAAERGLAARAHSEDSHQVMQGFGRDWDGVRTELEWFARSLDEQFDYLLAESAEVDVLVSATSELAAATVAEYRRIPYVRLAFAPMMTSYASNALLPWQGLPALGNRAGWSLLNALVELLAFRTVRRWRAALGLPLVVGVGDHIARRGLSLLAMSEALSPPCPSWRGRYRYEVGGYCFDPSDGVVPEAIRRFVEAGSTPIYVGLGSVTVDDPARFTELVRDAALRAGCRVLLGAGWTGLGAGLATRYLLPVGETDHRALFPLTAGVVHHGGSGTTHTAAAAGVPQLVLPRLADQH
jgi:UDP:flavonoid glycosyltransferase YjiC (YdhE family)